MKIFKMIITKSWLCLIFILLSNIQVMSSDEISTTDSTDHDKHLNDYIGKKAKFYVNAFIGLSNPIAEAGFEVVVDNFLPRFSFSYELSYLFGLDFFGLDKTINSSQFYGTGLSNKFSGGYCISQWNAFAENRLFGPKLERQSITSDGLGKNKKVHSTQVGYNAFKRLNFKFDFLVTSAFGGLLDESDCRCWKKGSDKYYIPKLSYETIGKGYDPHDIYDLGFIMNTHMDKYGWYFAYTNRYRGLEEYTYLLRFQFGVLYYKNAKIFVENDGCCEFNSQVFGSENNLIKKPTNPTILLKLLFGVTI
ncbi:MAG: hypothetical protein V1779_17035 [bacterium]